MSNHKNARHTACGPERNAPLFAWHSFLQQSAFCVRATCFSFSLQQFALLQRSCMLLQVVEGEEPSPPPEKLEPYQPKFTVLTYVTANEENAWSESP